MEVDEEGSRRAWWVRATWEAGERTLTSPLRPL
jgi:hypothetical protein